MLALLLAPLGCVQEIGPPTGDWDAYIIDCAQFGQDDLWFGIAHQGTTCDGSAVTFGCAEFQAAVEEASLCPDIAALLRVDLGPQASFITNVLEDGDQPSAVGIRAMCGTVSQLQPGEFENLEDGRFTVVDDQATVTWGTSELVVEATICP